MQFFKNISDIEKLRIKKGISIIQLCKNAGVHKSTYHRIRNNQVSPTIDTMQKLLGGLND
jgi:transcriptional regulator with XRE-family HTH domain